MRFKIQFALQPADIAAVKLERVRVEPRFQTSYSSGFDGIRECVPKPHFEQRQLGVSSDFWPKWPSCRSSLLILRVLIAGTPRLLCKFRVYCVPLLLFFAGCLQLSSLHIFECFFAVCFRLLCSCFLIVTFLPLAVVLFVCLASCLLSCCLRPYGPLSRHVIKRHHLVRERVSDRAPSPNEEAGEPPSPSEGGGGWAGLEM